MFKNILTITLLIVFVIGVFIFLDYFNATQKNPDGLDVNSIYKYSDRDKKAELEECMPKSDNESHKKCEEILDEIRNFDECVDAGFPIMESMPPQCAVPDRETFTKETNGTWDMALDAIVGCNVEQVFQGHNRIVKLDLKNGEKLIVAESRIDDIMDVVLKSEGVCGNIIISTE